MDRTRPRIIAYWLILIDLLVGAILVRGLTWSSGPYVHLLLDAVAAVTALAVGGLAIVRYHARPERLFLYTGVGFLGGGALTVLHALLTTPLVHAEVDAAMVQADAWTWMLSQTYVAVFVLAAYFAQDAHERPADNHRPQTTYLVGLLTALVVAVSMLWSQAPDAMPEGLGGMRPFELVPGALFTLALLGFLRRESWRTERFQHWLVVCLFVGALTHAAFMAFAPGPYSSLFDAAHVLKVVQYGAVLFGLLLALQARLKLGGQAFAAERILQESRRQLQDFLDNANDLLQSTGPDGRILYANRAWKKTLGYADQEIAALDLFSIVHPTYKEAFRDSFARVLRGESLRNVEVGFVARDGRIVLCSGNMNCRFEEGRPVATRSIFRDVTEQRKAELELEEFRANVTALVENTGDAIWSVDPEFRLITFNQAFALAVEAVSGAEPRVGDSTADTFPAGDVDWYEERYARALLGERFSDVHEEEMAGQTRHYELFFNPIDGDQGPRGVVVFSKDVSPRRRAEDALVMAKEEAEAANLAKSQFLASMSHELRTPLNSVIGFANILTKNRAGTLSEQDVEFTKRIVLNGKHLLTLINDVLDLAKVEAGRMEIELEEVDLDTLVKETLLQLEGQIKGRSVQLRGDVPVRTLPMRTDGRRLKQVIINLAGNALKFTEEGEVCVAVETDRAGRPRALRVRDTGIGIPEDRLSAIFDAFRQAEAGTNRRYGGTGLGLTISKSICQLLGYELNVSSELGKGSTFTITFHDEAEVTPDVPPAPPEEPAADLLLDPARRHLFGAPPDARTVLVIDDETDSRLLVQHYLEDFGCTVKAAGSADEGLRMAREDAPDLITLDLRMPGMSGWEFLRTIKEDPELQDIPVVVVSIVAGEGSGRLLGAVDLLTKPVEREDFLRVLWRCLPRAGRRVLVVDDDAETRHLIQSFLRSTEIEVQSVANGREALNVLAGYRPDLVLLDLVMPVMDGMTFLDEIRSDPEYLGLPVVVLTGKTLSQEELDRLQDRAASVMLKGDDLGARLKDAVERVFAERGVPVA